MTAREFLAAALRRWYVVVLGAVLTVGALAVVQRQAPVFFTQYNIVLVGPSGTEHTNVLENPRYGLQPLVGVISTDINDGHPPLLTGDVDATMVGMGAREGVQVRVPNLGTQWRPLFSANYLDVQVAASDARGGAGAGPADLDPDRHAPRAAAGRAGRARQPPRPRRPVVAGPDRLPHGGQQVPGTRRPPASPASRSPRSWSSGSSAGARAGAPPVPRRLSPRDGRWCVGGPARRR